MSLLNLKASLLLGNAILFGLYKRKLNILKIKTIDLSQLIHINPK